jgi:hypothetical protein
MNKTNEAVALMQSGAEVLFGGLGALAGFVCFGTKALKLGWDAGSEFSHKYLNDDIETITNYFLSDDTSTHVNFETVKDIYQKAAIAAEESGTELFFNDLEEYKTKYTAEYLQKLYGLGPENVSTTTDIVHNI